MCTSSVNALQAFDVNGTKETSTFQLHVPNLLAACDTIGPLPFCLIPPASRLQSMCASTLNEYFTGLLSNRNGITLDELPIVWDGLRESSTLQWIDIESSAQAIDSETYFGLQPCPTFASLAASAGSQELFGVANGTCFKTNPFSGFMEAQDAATGADDAFQRVLTNVDGGRGCVLFRNALYFWQLNQFEKQQQVSTEEYCWGVLQQIGEQVRLIVISHDIIANNCVWTEYNSNTSQLPFEQSSRATFAMGANDFIGWCASSVSFGTLIAIGQIGQPFYRVLAVRGAIFEEKWENVPWNEVVFGEEAWDAVCRETQTEVWITAANKIHAQAQVIQLDKRVPSGGGLTIGVSGSVRLIQESLKNDMFVFISNSQMYLCKPDELVASPIIVSGIPKLEWNASYAFAANINKFWYMSTNQEGSQLYSNTTEESLFFDTNFHSEFEVKLAVNMHVSDFGLPSITVQPKTTWFFGIHVVSRAQAGFDYYSPHQYYRIQIEPQIVASATQFPHVVTHLQRANFDALARGNMICLFNNSQTKILSPFESVILSRNMNNTWGEDNDCVTFAYIDETTRNISPNGLYIFYTPPLEFGLGPRVVLNVFNTGAFALFCKQGADAITKQRVGKAIEQQSLFCWQHLLLEDNVFLDPRCACIGGQKLLDKLYPSLAGDEQPWNSSRARMNQNFPCLSRTCQQAISQPETTLVYDVTQNKCQDADITMCTSTFGLLDDKSTLSIQIGTIIQNCNGSIGLQCSQDEACPLGSVCVNGRCAFNCKDNTECGPQSMCVNGTCLSTSTTSANAQQDARRVAKITLIAIIVIVVILLITLIIIVTRRRK